MTDKFNKMFGDLMQEINEDLSQQGKGMLAKPVGGNMPTSTTSSSPATKPVSAASPIKPSANLSGQSNVTNNTMSNTGSNDYIKNLSASINGNDVDNIAKSLSDITANDPDFFDKPEAQEVNLWASNPDNMKALQQAQAKLIQNAQNTKGGLTQMYNNQQ